MNSGTRLQIRHLSKTGELLKCINCFPGQLSVFRAYSDAELLPYQRALSGRPGAERFSISLDYNTFRPDEHILIGFGERLPLQLRVEDYCRENNVPEDSYRSLLLSYGLEAFVDSSCAQLNDCAARRLQLLCATYNEAAVMILNNPFEPISSHWRERFAELLLNDARSKQRIIIIPSLTYRPQAFIGNEFVQRVQVGENLQKTIGFGGGAEDVNQMVKQMRELLKDEDALQDFLRSQSGTVVKPPSQSVDIEESDDVPEETPSIEASSETESDHSDSAPSADLIAPTEAKPLTSSIPLTSSMTRLSSSLPSMDTMVEKMQMAGGHLPRTRTRMASLLGLLTVAIIVAFVSWSGDPTPARTPMVATVPSAPKVVPKKNPQTKIAQKPPQVKPEPKLPFKPVPPKPPVVVAKPPPKPKYVLDHYPVGIRKDVLLAFASGSGNAPKFRTVSVKSPEKQPPGNKSLDKDLEKNHPLAALQNLSGTGDKTTSAPASVLDKYTNNSKAGDYEFEKDMDERQKRIRQKFMEAINRAIERREREGK